MASTTLKISSDTADHLSSQAEALGLSIEAYLEKVIGPPKPAAPLSPAVQALVNRVKSRTQAQKDAAFARLTRKGPARKPAPGKSIIDEMVEYWPRIDDTETPIPAGSQEP